MRTSSAELVCDSTIQKYSDGTTCEPICDPLTLKYEDGRTCELAGQVPATTTIVAVPTTTTFAVPTDALPVTGQGLALPAVGGIILAIGALMTRLAHRREISH